MRILHISYGSPMIELSKGLQLKGIQSTSCHFDRHPFNFTPDVCLNVSAYPAQKRHAIINRYLQQSMRVYDVFHFHFGATFFPDKSDLKMLKQAGKKMVVHHHGSDIRRLSIAQKNNPYVRVKPEWTEEKIKHDVSVLSTYIDHAIVQDAELEGYITDFYKHVHVIPHAITCHQFEPHYPPVPHRKPLVVHAPTKRDLKGTDDIIEAVEHLQQANLLFDFKLIEGADHQETMRLLSEADMVIDQLRIGSYGYLSSEAMALGKPVICYIRDDLKTKYPADLPIVNANPDTITTVLRDLISAPQHWRDLGKQGRTYVERYHDTNKVINQYVAIYRQLMGH